MTDVVWDVVWESPESFEPRDLGVVSVWTARNVGGEKVQAALDAACADESNTNSYFCVLCQQVLTRKTAMRHRDKHHEEGLICEGAERLQLLRDAVTTNFGASAPD